MLGIFVALLYLSTFLSIAALDDKEREVAEEELFLACDLNKDGRVSLFELKTCSGLGGEKEKEKIASEVFRVFDRDEDSFLSKEEYNVFVAMSTSASELNAKNKNKRKDNINIDRKEEIGNDDEEEVEVIDRHGKRKIMKRSEFDRESKLKMDGVNMDDGEMTKVEEGQTTFNKAKEDNPGLARVMGMGKWIQFQLQEMGYTSGNITNLRTLDSREKGLGQLEHMNKNENFEIRFEIKLKKPKDKGGKIETFEVLLEKNKRLYLKPYFALKEIFALNDGRSKLRCPEPPLRSWLVRDYLGPIVLDYGTPILLVMLCIIIWCTVQSLRKTRNTLRNTKSDKTD